MKNFLTFIISTTLTFVICYLFFFFNIQSKNLKDHPYIFKSKETLNFNKKYYNKFHHLRPINGEWEIYEPENYLFNVVNDFSDKKNNILLQGDSWIQQIHELEVKESHNLFKNFVIENNFGLVNAGVTSFSPSLMQLQYDVLEKDFHIKPNIVIAYIDQTDIGDELCRYKNKRVYDKNNNLISIKKEQYTRATYDYGKIFYISEVLLNYNSTLVRNFKITNFFIKYELLRLSNKIKNIMEKGWKNKDIHKCFFPEIKKYLIKSDVTEISYFEDRLRDYVNFLLSKEYIDKIIFVTFPHYTHIFGYNIISNQKETYNVNVSDIVEKTVINHQKIYHLNFSELADSGKIKIKRDSYYGDAASHTTVEFHSKVFTKQIINFLK